MDRKAAPERFQQQQQQAYEDDSVATGALPTQHGEEDYDDFYIYGNEDDDRIDLKNPPVNLDEDFDEKEELICMGDVSIDDDDKGAILKTLVKSAIEDEHYVIHDDQRRTHASGSGDMDSKSESDYIEITTTPPSGNVDLSNRGPEKLYPVDPPSNTLKFKYGQSLLASSDSSNNNNDLEFMSKSHYDEKYIYDLKNVECIYSLNSYAASNHKDARFLYSRETGRLILTTYRLIFIPNNADAMVKEGRVMDLDLNLQLFNCPKLPFSVVIFLTSIFEIRACMFKIFLALSYFLLVSRMKSTFFV
jgi:hypothetical protein